MTLAEATSFRNRCAWASGPTFGGSSPAPFEGEPIERAVGRLPLSEASFELAARAAASRQTLGTSVGPRMLVAGEGDGGSVEGDRGWARGGVRAQIGRSVGRAVFGGVLAEQFEVEGHPPMEGGLVAAEPEAGGSEVLGQAGLGGLAVEVVDLEERLLDGEQAFDLRPGRGRGRAGRG